MEIPRSSFYNWKQNLSHPANRTLQLVENISLFRSYHLKYPSHGYRWLNAKIRLDTGLVLSDPYAHKCCTMMLICRLFDGVSDILMGMIIDKTHTKWGKARPWLLFMGLPLIVSVFLTFHVPASMSEGGQKVYTFATYFFMSVICYTAVNLAYHSMLPRFSLTSQDRSVTSVIRSIF